MNNAKKNWFIKFLLLLVCFLLFLSISANAQEEKEDKSDIDPYVDGNLSIAKCIAKGNIEFLLFLNTFIYNDGFYEGIIEPWKDVLMRNQCHSLDVTSLIKQQDKIRKYIRDAFLTCNSQKMPSLKAAFNKLNAEIYYVRHVIDGKVVVSLPYSWASTRQLENPDALIYPREKLYSEMYDRYVKKGVFKKEDFDQLFINLEFKYDSRKQSYIICESSSWDVVVQKWEEFVNTAGGITPAAKKFKKRVGGRAEKIVEAATDMGWKAYLTGLVQVNLNNLDIKPGFEEISENISDYIPNIDVPTQSAFLDALRIADRQYNLEKIRQEISSNFDALYKTGSDSGTELLVTELDNFNNILLDSFSPLSRVLECTNAMNKRQCPGKF